MKFNEKLNTHLTPEWRTQYIEYQDLKDFLYKSLHDIEELAKKLGEANRKYAALLEELESYLESVNKTHLASEHAKRPTGYTEHKSPIKAENASETSLKRGLTSLKVLSLETDEETVVRRRLPYIIPKKKDSKVKTKEKKTFRKLHDLRLAFSEFYLSLVLIQNYQSLNFTGFRKILKKHDKLFQRQTGAEWREQIVQHSPFFTVREVDGLITNVENIFTHELEHGDRQKAMKRLRVPPLAEQHHPYALFRFGLYVGVFVAQVFVIALVCIFLRPLPLNYDKALDMFRSTFLIILFICLLGINTYGWRSSGVNNILIFEIDPRTHLNHFQLLEAAFFLATVWGMAVIYFLFSEVIGWPAYLSPLVLVIFMILFLLNPGKFFYSQARRWLWKILWRVLRAPFKPVAFADFWLADQLNSLGFIFVELARFICFYTTQIDWVGGMRYQPVINATYDDDDDDDLIGTFTVPTCAAHKSKFVSDSCRCSGLMFGIVPLLQILPAWFRFAQCMRRFIDLPVKTPHPHLVNAGKYSTSFFTAIGFILYQLTGSTTAFGFYIASLIVSSIYTYSWDIWMDWGLMNWNSENFLLRDELVYRYKAYYYAAMIEDFVIRFSWTVRIVVVQSSIFSYRRLILTITMFAEVMRRFIWNFFRLENEHLNNCGQFRAVREIYITPLPKTPAHSASMSTITTTTINHTFPSPLSPNNFGLASSDKSIGKENSLLTQQTNAVTETSFSQDDELAKPLANHHHHDMEGGSTNQTGRRSTLKRLVGKFGRSVSRTFGLSKSTSSQPSSSQRAPIFTLDESPPETPPRLPPTEASSPDAAISANGQCQTLATTATTSTSMTTSNRGPSFNLLIKKRDVISNLYLSVPPIEQRMRNYKSILNQRQSPTRLQARSQDTLLDQSHHYDYVDTGNGQSNWSRRFVVEPSSSSNQTDNDANDDGQIASTSRSGGLPRRSTVLALVERPPPPLFDEDMITTAPSSSYVPLNDGQLTMDEVALRRVKNSMEQTEKSQSSSPHNKRKSMPTSVAETLMSSNTETDSNKQANDEQVSQVAFQTGSEEDSDGDEEGSISTNS